MPTDVPDPLWLRGPSPNWSLPQLEPASGIWSVDLGAIPGGIGCSHNGGGGIFGPHRGDRKLQWKSLGDFHLAIFVQKTW